MKLVFITNLIHHHQIPLADEFYKILADNYVYVATEQLPEWLIKGGYDPSITRPYIVRAYENDGQKEHAIKLANEADVVVSCVKDDVYILDRLKQNKLTFRVAERYFKSKPWYFPNPITWLRFYKKHFRYRNKPLYMLAASAYTANDVYHMHCYKDKVYKWGYFTKVDDYDIEQLPKFKSLNSAPRMMWCARFLDWKHPELPIKLAHNLKSKGYLFCIDMYGSGVEFDKMKQLATKLNVNDVLAFRGNLPNDEILRQMREHDIFLFTSDKGEGWGAVLNESMSNGCAVVASDMIGSAPYLVIHKKNGLLFKSGEIESFTEQVEYLFTQPGEIVRLAKNAIITMRNLWSPAVAAKRFINLCNNTLEGKDTFYSNGPCSNAYPFIREQ